MQSSHSNQTVFERDAWQYQSEHYLLPAERVALEKLRLRWNQIDMLDLGVGAGRTSWIFSAVARKYVGVDYALRMIDICREKLKENDRISFLVDDAAELSKLGAQKFDFILFSYNGIDCVDENSRLAILNAARYGLRDRDSLFRFSSHNLNVFPFAYQWNFDLQRPARTLKNFPRAVWDNVRFWKENRSQSRDELAKRGWGFFRDGAHNFTLTLCYITPEAQIKQLEACGLELLEIIDMAGNTVVNPCSSTDSHLHYFCRLAK